jgi:hypothetical protein
MGSSLRPQEFPSPELVVRESVPQDVRDLAPRLRIMDKMEIAAATGEKPLIALGRGFADSKPCYTVDYKGTPCAMFGVVPDLSGTHFTRFGAIWLLGSDDIPLFRKSFLKNSKAWVAQISEGFDVVGNYVDARNLRHIRWLKWLGFKFVGTVKRGPLNLPFHEFYKVP